VGGRQQNRTQAFDMVRRIDRKHLDAPLHVGQVDAEPSGEKTNPVKLNWLLASGARLCVNADPSPVAGTLFGGNGTVCTIFQFSGSMMTRSCVLPDAARMLCRLG
jgi:hypothetical protein